MSIHINKKIILKDINFVGKTNDVIAIIGPNGAGKSSLIKTIMHHYAFNVKNGDILFNNISLLKKQTNEIAKLGFFYLSQNPIELEGIKLIDLLKSINDSNKKKISLFNLYDLVNKKFNDFNLDKELLQRDCNVNFSGGQKKKNEMVQLFLFNSKVLLLDEIDSGCDVDSLKIIANEINKIKKDKIIIIISHQESLLKMIKPTKYITIANKTIIDRGNSKKLFIALKKGFKKYEKKNNNKQELISLKNVF